MDTNPQSTHSDLGKSTAHDSDALKTTEDNGPGGKPDPAVVSDDEDHEHEDYNWSTDEDLIDEEAKFDQKSNIEKPKRRWGPKRIATFFLSTLVGSTLLAGLIITIPLLLHFFYYRTHPSDRRKYITDNVSAWHYWAAANVLLSWYLAMIVDVIPIFLSAIIDLIWGEVNETIRSRIELYNAGKDDVKPVLYGTSAWVSWIVIFDGIYSLYDHHDTSRSRAQYTERTYQAIQFLFFFTLAVSLEKMLFHMIAFAFHRKAFNERLATLKHHLHVVDHLRSYRPKRHNNHHAPHHPLFSLANLNTHNSRRGKLGFIFGHGRKQEPLPHTVKLDTRDITSDDEGHVGDIEEGTGYGAQHSKKGKQLSIMQSKHDKTRTEGLPVESVASTESLHHKPRQHIYPPSIPGEHNGGFRSERLTPHVQEPTMVGQAAKALKTAVLHDARNLTGGGDMSADFGWSVTSAHEAKHLARSIYTAFKMDHHRSYLIPSDFYPAYAKQEDAEDAFKVFDTENHGDITRAEIKTAILKLYRERRALNRSMRDVGDALRTLDWIMTCFAMVALFFTSLFVFHVGLGKSLTSFYSIGIAASFIFKNAASNAFDSVVFLFVTHPFDTGDRCFINGENLVVKKMGLFATTFLRSDGTQSYYFNSQLFGKFITNVRRSGKMYESITLQVAWRTPMEKLDQLGKSMNEWLATEENRWYEPTTGVTLQKIEYQRCLEFTMSIGHNGTWQDWGLRNARKTAFAAAVHYYCRQLGITYYKSTQPIYLAAENEENVGIRLPDKPSASASQRQSQVPAPPGLSPSNVDAASFVGGENESVLGFKPPGVNQTNLRSRKTKRVVRGVGDGGDGGDAG